MHSANKLRAHGRIGAAERPRSSRAKGRKDDRRGVYLIFAPERRKETLMEPQVGPPVSRERASIPPPEAGQTRRPPAWSLSFHLLAYPKIGYYIRFLDMGREEAREGAGGGASVAAARPRGRRMLPRRGSGQLTH